MLPIAWWACRSCSTRARSPASPPQTSPGNVGHWSAARSRAARKIDRACSSIALMRTSPAHRFYQGVRRGLASFLTTAGKNPRPLRVLQQLAAQPGPRVRPVPVGGGRRDAQRGGGLVEGQAAEVAQLDDVPREGVEGRQPEQGVVQGDELVGGDG